MLDKPLQNLSEEVRLVLAEREIEFSIEGGTLFWIDHGSAEVQIEIVDAPPTPTIAVRADVLVGLDVRDTDSEVRMFRVLNERNAHLRFGKFYFDPTRACVVVEYEILASHMQREELAHAVTVVATLADDHDDLLMEHLGQGQRASDLRGRARPTRFWLRPPSPLG